MDVVMPWTLLLVLSACHGKDGDDTTGHSDEPADSQDPACLVAPDPAVSSDAWEATDAPPAGGIWTYAMGPGGVPLYDSADHDAHHD